MARAGVSLSWLDVCSSSMRKNQLVLGLCFNCSVRYDLTLACGVDVTLERTPVTSTLAVLQ